MTYHHRPGPGKNGAILAVDEHHAGNDPSIMLPSVAKLMPPFLLNDLIFVNLIYCPQVAVGLIEKDGLKDVMIEWDGSLVFAMIHPELMLIIGAVERHLNPPSVFRIGVGVAADFSLQSESTSEHVLLTTLVYSRQARRLHRCLHSSQI